MTDQQQNSSRRNFLKKAAYVAPVIMTLKVTPSIASSGSGMTTQNSSCTLNHDHSTHDGRRIRRKRWSGYHD